MNSGARRALAIGLLLAAGCAKKAPPVETTGESSPPVTKDAPAGSATTLSAAVTPPALPLGSDQAGEAPPARSLVHKKVLHVGDSMVGGSFGLTRALESKLDAAGAKIVRHTKVSETITSFEKAPTLKDLIRTHDPDIVIITLGANDALVPHPEVFAKSVANITHRVGDRECWWMGPPMWTKDTGIVKVIRENVGTTCRFFDASQLELERASDGIHPNDRGAAKWADAFWEVFRDPA